MENKLDILTRKLYDEGINKAKREAEELIEQARKDAEKIITDAKQKAEDIEAKAKETAENTNKKAEAEMSLSARQAVVALQQEITTLVSGKVAKEMAKSGFEDKTFVQELLMSVVKKWDIATGRMDLEILLPEEEKKQLEDFVARKYKDMLDKGLEIKTGTQKEAFILQPQDGSYKITFSEELFESFFNQYIRSLSKGLLYKSEELLGMVRNS